jgi:hypothetical protein
MGARKKRFWIGLRANVQASGLKVSHGTRVAKQNSSHCRKAALGRQGRNAPGLCDSPTGPKSLRQRTFNTHSALDRWSVDDPQSEQNDDVPDPLDHFTPFQITTPARARGWFTCTHPFSNFV